MQNPWDKYEEVEEPTTSPWDKYEPVEETFPTRFNTQPTVVNESAPWLQKMRTPLTDIGRRTSRAITNQPVPKVDDIDPNLAVEMETGKNLINFAGDMFDEATSAINILPSALLGAGKYFAKPAITALGRIASIPTAISGSEKMKNAQNFTDATLGAIEAIGGVLGMRAPKPKPKVEMGEGFLGPTPVIKGNVKLPTPDLTFAELDKRMKVLYDKEIAGTLTGDELKEAQELNKKWRNHPEFGKTPTPETTGVETPKVTSTKGKLDYSPSSESAARKILQEYGHQIPEGASNKQIIELAETVKPGWQTTTTKPVAPKDPTVINPKAPKPKIQINMKGEIIHPDYPDYVLDKDGNILRTISGKPITPLPEEKGRNLVLEVLNTPRAVNASMDLSFPFRQGVTMMHKPAWWTSWGDMVKAFGSDKAFQGTMDAIHQKPNYKPNINYKNAQGKPTSFADWSGLAITDMGSNRELEHMRSLAERVPGYKQIVGASNRAYTAYANKLRSDVFDSLVDDFTKAGMDPRKDKKLAQTIAGFVNNASGRGSVKELERYMEGLNTVFFSPRLQISRAQMLGKSARAIFDPRVYDMSQPSIRREYLKSMLTLGGAWSTAAALASQAGAQVSLDPTNPDFMKIRIGDTRMDPGGGFQQFIVLANKIAQQKATSSTTGETKRFADAKTMYDPTMGNTLGRFTRSKMAPLPGAALDLASATQNDQFDLLDTALRMGSPILVQDLMEILMNEGISPELLSIPPTMVGIGAQTYGTGKQDRKMLGPNSPTDLTFPKKKNQKGMMF